MKRFFKIKRKESPRPPQLPISPGNPANITAGSSGFSAQSDASLEGAQSLTRIARKIASSDCQLDKGGGTNTQIDYQERADEDQGLPASQACGSTVVIGRTDSGSKLTGGCS